MSSSPIPSHAQAEYARDFDIPTEYEDLRQMLAQEAPLHCQRLFVGPQHADIYNASSL